MECCSALCILGIYDDDYLLLVTLKYLSLLRQFQNNGRSCKCSRYLWPELIPAELAKLVSVLHKSMAV